jgi:hypothetical protein
MIGKAIEAAYRGAECNLRHGRIWQPRVIRRAQTALISHTSRRGIG